MDGAARAGSVDLGAVSRWRCARGYAGAGVGVAVKRPTIEQLDRVSDYLMAMAGPVFIAFLFVAFVVSISIGVVAVIGGMLRAGAGC